jgi:hypothetical protein
VKYEFSLQIFKKSSNTEYHENPSRESRFFHADGRKNIKKLIITFCDFLETPNNGAGEPNKLKRKRATVPTLVKVRNKQSISVTLQICFYFIWNKSVNRHKLNDCGCLLW